VGGKEALRRAIHVVPSDDGIHIDLQRLLDAIDEETLIVPISHVLFKAPSSWTPRRSSTRPTGSAPS